MIRKNYRSKRLGPRGSKSLRKRIRSRRSKDLKKRSLRRRRSQRMRRRSQRMRGGVLEGVQNVRMNPEVVKEWMALNSDDWDKKWKNGRGRTPCIPSENGGTANYSIATAGDGTRSLSTMTIPANWYDGAIGYIMGAGRPIINSCFDSPAYLVKWSRSWDNFATKERNYYTSHNGTRGPDGILPKTLRWWTAFIEENSLISADSTEEQTEEQIARSRNKTIKLSKKRAARWRLGLPAAQAKDLARLDNRTAILKKKIAEGPYY